MRNEGGSSAHAPGRKTMLAAVLTLALGCTVFAGAALASGKPDKAYLESKFHVIWPGLRSPELSRFTGDQLHTEHARDLRMVPGVLRYAHDYPLPWYDQRSTWDVITELYFEDMESATRSLASPENRVGSDPWMARMSGGGKVGPRPWRPGIGGLVVQDRVIVDGHEWGYKWMSFMRRKDGVSKEQADAYMRDVYAPALAKLPGVRRYVLGQSYVPKNATGLWAIPPKFDAVDMIWFDSLEDMRRFLASMDYQQAILHPAETQIIDRSKTISFAADFIDSVPFPPRYEGPKWQDPRPAQVTK